LVNYEGKAFGFAEVCAKEEEFGGWEIIGCENGFIQVLPIM
jgi:hypothetical protein